MTVAVWAGWAKLQSILATAAGTMTVPITLVARGVPLSVPTDMIRYWYDGNGASPFSPGDTLTASQEGVNIRIGVFLRMPGGGTLAGEAAVDDRLENADNAIQGALLDDPFLGTFPTTNDATGIEIGDTSTSVENVDGALVRYLEIPITYGVADRHVIG